MPDSSEADRLRRRLADAELAQQSLVEQGMALERRLEEVLESRTWRAQRSVFRAVRSPSRLLRLPVELWRALTEPPGPAPEPARSDSTPSPEEWPPETRNKPRLLFVLPWLRIGGAERVVLDLIDGLGDAVAVAAATTKDVPHGWEAEFRRRTPMIFHAGGRSDVTAFLARLVREQAIEGVVISSTDDGYDALGAMRSAGVRWAADIVHSDAPTGWLAKSVDAGDLLDRRFAIGERQARSLREAGAAAESVVVARNGADIDRLDPSRARFQRERAARRAEVGVSDDAVLVAFVGRLSVEKGPLLFLDAVEDLSRRGIAVRAVMVGDGPQRFAVERRVRQSALRDLVHVAGMSAWPEDWLAAADALAIPSRDEGLPLVLLDAMALGVPAVATDVGAISEAIEDGVTGRLVRERSATAFADALEGLIVDARARRAMGEAAREKAVDEFSLARTQEIYRMEILAALKGVDYSIRR